MSLAIIGYFIETGKTLILDAAAKTLSEREDTEVVFICAICVGEECDNAEICCQAVLVKYLSAWDECWGKGIESPSGSNVIDGIGVANPFQLNR